MNDFISTKWQNLLNDHGLRDFEDFWNLAAEWFEAPNQRRGGWSGVGTVQLTDQKGEQTRFFLKRQEDHSYRTWRHPISGELTFCREMANLLTLRQAQVPTLEPVYFAHRQIGQHQRAILMTVALSEFIPLDQAVQRWQQTGFPPLQKRLALFRALAQALQNLHQLKFQHSCLYPKHIFIRETNPSAPSASPFFEIRLIDLEKAHSRFRKEQAMVHDLSTLHRRSPEWRRVDRLRFLCCYLGQERVTPVVRRFWKILSKRRGPVNRLN